MIQTLFVTSLQLFSFSSSPKLSEMKHWGRRTISPKLRNFIPLTPSISVRRQTATFHKQRDERIAASNTKLMLAVETHRVIAYPVIFRSVKSTLERFAQLLNHEIVHIHSLCDAFSEGDGAPDPNQLSTNWAFSCLRYLLSNESLCERLRRDGVPPFSSIFLRSPESKHAHQDSVTPLSSSNQIFQLQSHHGARMNREKKIK